MFLKQILARTTLTQTIILHQLVVWLLKSNHAITVKKIVQTETNGKVNRRLIVLFCILLCRWSSSDNWKLTTANFQTLCVTTTDHFSRSRVVPFILLMNKILITIITKEVHKGRHTGGNLYLCWSPLSGAFNFHTSSVKRRLLKLEYFLMTRNLLKISDARFTEDFRSRSRTFLKVAKDDPNASEDFQGWVEILSIFLKMTRTLPKMIGEHLKFLMVTDGNRS